MSSPVVKPMSCQALVKAWYCEAAFTRDGAHFVHVWEPLDVDLPETARPYCYGAGEIDFYDKTGNTVLWRRVRHHQFCGGKDVLLLSDGRFYEVYSGQVLFREGRWFMRWWCGDNTRAARMLNAGWPEYQR